MCNLIQWSGLWWYPTIGYNAERLHYENHHLTGQSDANEIDCTDSDSLYTNVVYKIRVLDTDISSLQSQCSIWFYSDSGGGNEEVMDFSNTQPACPCTLSQAQQDRRFSLFTAKDNSSCYIQRLPNVRGGAQECCYSTSPQIFGTLVCQGRSSGGLLRYHPWYSPTEYNEYDRDAQNTCCFPTINNSLCMLYHMRRPSNCCEGYVPQPRRKFIYKLAFDCNFSG